MVECIFAEHVFAAPVIEGDQPHDHFVGRRGLREGDRLLKDNAVRRRNERECPATATSTPLSSQKQRSTRFAPLKFAARRPIRMSSSAVTVHSTLPPEGGAYSRTRKPVSAARLRNVSLTTMRSDPSRANLRIPSASAITSRSRSPHGRSRTDAPRLLPLRILPGGDPVVGKHCRVDGIRTFQSTGSF